MAEYIEREAVFELLRDNDFCVSSILAIPAADVAPVVRCRDCIRCEEERTAMGHVLFCYHWVRNTTEDGYCHEGVAMEGR